MLSKTDVTLQEKERKLLSHQKHFASQQALMSISNSRLCTCEQWQPWPWNCDTSGFFSAAMSTSLLGRFSSLGPCRSCCWLFSIGISCCVIDNSVVYNYKDRHLSNTIHITPQKKENNLVYPSKKCCSEPSIKSTSQNCSCTFGSCYHDRQVVKTLVLNCSCLSCPTRWITLLGPWRGCSWLTRVQLFCGVRCKNYEEILKTANSETGSSSSTAHQQDSSTFSCNPSQSGGGVMRCHPWHKQHAFDSATM